MTADVTDHVGNDCVIRTNHVGLPGLTWGIILAP